MAREAISACSRAAIRSFCVRLSAAMSRAIVIAHSSPSSSTVEPDSRKGASVPSRLRIWASMLRRMPLVSSSRRKRRPSSLFPHTGSLPWGALSASSRRVTRDPRELAVDLDSAAVDQAEDHDRVAGRFEDFAQLGLALGAPPLALHQRRVALGEAAAIEPGQMHRVLSDQRPRYHSKPAEVHVRIGRRRQRLVDRKRGQTKDAQPCLPAFAPWNECSRFRPAGAASRRTSARSHDGSRSSKPCRPISAMHSASVIPRQWLRQPSAKAEREGQARQSRSKQIDSECQPAL